MIQPAILSSGLRVVPLAILDEEAGTTRWKAPSHNNFAKARLLPPQVRSNSERGRGLQKRQPSFKAPKMSPSLLPNSAGTTPKTIEFCVMNT